MSFDVPKRVVHGGTGKRYQEKTGNLVLDFSASVNPFPPRFAWHWDPDLFAQYPDNEYACLKERIAQVYGRRPEEICVGNGSIELIRIFCSVILDRHKTFFLQEPTFGEYEMSARLTGASRSAIRETADLTFVCNPNNPTGTLHRKSGISAMLDQVASHDGMLFCDEAFIDLCDPEESMADTRHPRLFVLHSLTKSFSVPGIRFGYGFGSPDLIDKIETVRPPWSVNAVAESFAMEALLHRKDLAVSRDLIAKERQWLENEITCCGLSPCPSSTNFILLDCRRAAGPLVSALAAEGILVRDCTSFGLPDHIRISIRTRDENRRFVEALQRCVR